MLGIWDRIAAATKSKGKEIVVFGEEGDYDFGEHDRTPSNTDLGKFSRAGGTSRADSCFQSVMFSCHVQGLRHHIGPALADLSALYPPSRAVRRALRGGHAYGMLMGARNPVL